MIRKQIIFSFLNLYLSVTNLKFILIDYDHLINFIYTIFQNTNIIRLLVVFVVVFIILTNTLNSFFRFSVKDYASQSCVVFVVVFIIKSTISYEYVKQN